jgi:hypothetical protein
VPAIKKPFSTFYPQGRIIMKYLVIPAVLLLAFVPLKLSIDRAVKALGVSKPDERDFTRPDLSEIDGTFINN